MILSDDIKHEIKTEYENWFNEQYGDKTLEERKALGAFFTPPELTIKMIEKFDAIEDKAILDPTCGTGNLLAGCIIAGANPKKVYGNEIDPEFCRLAQERLKKFGVPKHHIHIGDALDPECLTLKSFKREYKRIKYEVIDLW